MSVEQMRSKEAHTFTPHTMVVVLHKERDGRSVMGGMAMYELEIWRW